MRTPHILLATIAIAAASCGGAGDEAEVALDLHWNIWSGGQLVTCADVNAVSVDWLLEGEDARDFPFTFDCVDHLSSQVLVPEQVYGLSAKLRRTDGVVIGQCLGSYDPADQMGADSCDFEVP